MYLLSFKNALNGLTKEIPKTQNVFPTIFVIIVRVESFYVSSQVIRVNLLLYLCRGKFDFFSRRGMFLKIFKLLSLSGSQ